MTAPYAPVPFAAPSVNPAVGGAGVPVAYVSNSQFTFAPTAIDVNSLVPGGSSAQQAQALADTIVRASAWADRYCFGADPAAKGSSLAASVSVESARVTSHGGEYRLVCDYKPILSVLGVDMGATPQSLNSIGTGANLRFGRRTIYVPTATLETVGRVIPGYPSTMLAVWSYVNGYAHTSLATATVVGATSITVAATDGSAGVLGVYPGSRLTIIDAEKTEPVTVQSVSGTTITVAPLRFAHTPATAPDFTPVTAIPAEVTQAVIFLCSALIKTRGDNSMVLASLSEPKSTQAESGDEFTDVSLAKQLLAPYRVLVKDGR